MSGKSLFIVNRARPSIGQFWGRYNINNRDFSADASTNETRLNTASHVPDFSESEYKEVLQNLKDALHDWELVGDSTFAQVRWPNKVFYLDRFQVISRSINLYVGTCVEFLLADVERIRAALERFPLWRVIIRMPAAKYDPDITIYPDTYLIGDVAEMTNDDYRQQQRQWYEVEKEKYQLQSEHFRALENSKVESMLSFSPCIFRLACINKPTSHRDDGYDATIWIGSQFENELYRFRPCELIFADGEEYYPDGPWFGAIDESRRWRFLPQDIAAAQIGGFNVPQSRIGEEATLICHVSSGPALGRMELRVEMWPK